MTETLTVTASRGGERPAAELPVSITVIPRETLEKTPAATVDELLRTIPGLELPLQSSTVYFPAAPSVSLRGLGLGDNATRTLVLLDGLPMNGAFFGNVFWNRVSKQDTERVEVVRGASSSLFGSFAMGGVINLVTRPAQSPRTLAVDVLGGSDQTFQGNAFGAAEAGGSLRLSASLSGLTTDGYQTLAPEDRGAIDEKSGAGIKAAHVKAEADLGPRARLQARAGTYTEEHDAETRLSRNESEVSDLALGLVWQGASASQVVADLFYVDEEFSTDNVSLLVPGSRDAEFVSNAHETPADDFGGSVAWSRAFAARDAVLALGMDYRRLSGEDDAEIFAAPGVLAFAKNGSGEQTALGLFAELGWSPHAKLEVQTSLRVDRFETADGRDVTAGVVTDFPDKEFDEFSPRLGLRYQTTPAVALRGAFYRGFRAPTLAELYRAFGTSTFQGLPNPQLDPERLTGGEIGLDLTTGRVFSQVNAFYNRLEDLVGGIVVAFDPIFTLENQNIGEARSRGIEVISEASLEAWSVTASYVWTDAEITDNLDDPGLVGNDLEGAPEHAANLTLGWQASPKLDLFARGRYRSEQFQDATNETFLPSHSVLDASASYRVGDLTTLLLEVTNLLGRDYTASAFGGLNRLGAPRQWLLGVRWRNRS